MNCRQCGRENRRDANFCRYCSAHFALACAHCRTVLPDDSLFCDACGRPVDQATAPQAASGVRPTAAPTTPAPPTPQATAMPPSQAAIPEALMRRLEQARARGEMVGERRIVTMLFCDVNGSTAVAEQLDPEDFTEIINGAFAHIIEPIYRYEGTLARLMGDALLAFFGAPIAHEDDPQRAVLAGLDMVANLAPYRAQVQQRWGVEFDVRVGINTGLVVVGAVGSDLRLEYSALGDAINLAARMEQTAAPGTVQISHDTYKLVSGQFNFEPLGAIHVKGKSEPVDAYRVVGRKAAANRQRGIEGLHVEMVGRAAELSALAGVVSGLRQGLGRIVCVLGEAGMGKSRLIAEARAASQRAPGAHIEWFETNSLSYETQQAYGSFSRLILRMCAVNRTDPPAALRASLAALTHSMPAETQTTARQVFEALLGLDGSGGPPLEGEDFKKAVLDTMQAWWRTRFEQRPAVIVFDDMHWCDAASINLLLQLLPLTGELPLVLLCALRAERQSPAWQVKVVADEAHTHRYLELALQPLSDADSRELVNRLLAIADLPDRLCANILEKAGGNPFFIEEVVRTLIESGVVTPEDRPTPDGKWVRYWRASGEHTSFAIPSSVQALLSSRMDRLEDGARGTLQMASVIGRSFYRRVLQAVDEANSHLDTNLATLLRLDMIREAARVPEVEYAFRNPLTQEAVYDTILHRRRREFHGRVGQALEALYPDRLEGLYGLLTHHFALAGDKEKAIHYARLAANQAVQLYAYEDAVAGLRAALQLAGGAIRPESQLGLLEDMADLCRLLRDGSDAIAHYQQALALLESSHTLAADPLASVRLHRKIVQVVNDLKWTVSLEQLEASAHSRVTSRDHLLQALPALEAQPAHIETLRALTTLSTDSWRMMDPPDWDAAQRFAQAAVRLAEHLNSPTDQSQALGALATVLSGRSMLRQHLQAAHQRLALCRATLAGDSRETLDSLRGAGAAHMYAGEYEHALPLLVEAEALAVHVRAVDQQASALGLQAQCHYRLDRWDDVLALEEKWRALERGYARERIGEMCFYVALSACVHALRGSEQEAQNYTRESYDFMVGVSGGPEKWQRNQFY